MEKINDSFNGYLTIDNDKFVFNVSNHLVSILPAQSVQSKIYDSYNRARSRSANLPEYLLGTDNNTQIALLHNREFSSGIFGINPSLQFATPIIVKADGNTANFYNNLTTKWTTFHAITFWGGNLNSIYSPEIALEPENIDELLKHDGARSIKIRPWDDYTHSIDLIINDAKVTLTISISQNGNVNTTSAYNLGELNTLFRFSFEKAQSFDFIEQYYSITSSLVSLLTKQNNVSFNAYLSQRNSENLFFKTAICKINDPYDNYCVKKSHNVISLHNIMSQIPNLIYSIINKETLPLITLLPNNNNELNRISITNIQDLCTSLEVAYTWSHKGKEKNELINELKQKIKDTINIFSENHSELDISKQTTISSAFQYLDYTLKEKILSLYVEHKDLIDSVSSRYHLSTLDEKNIALFVKLRNAKTHSGTIDWGENAKIYPLLFALNYVCFLEHLGVPNESITSIIMYSF